jgi:hypothetical protein
VNKVDLNRVLEVYRDRFADLSDITLYIVGDFDTDSLKTLLGHYVASLPASVDGRYESPRDIGYRLYDHHIDTRWTRKMENPQDKVNCYTCHQGNIMNEEIAAKDKNPHTAKHFANGMNCLTCHSGVVHKDGANVDLPSRDRCYTCHLDAMGKL